MYCHDEQFAPPNNWKITGVYYSEDRLMERLKNDIRAIQRQLINTVDDENMSQKMFRLLVNESPGFLYLHLFKDIVIAKSDRVATKKPMLDYCRTYYATNQAELRKIDRFDRTYQSEKAITWYTKPCFLYRIISKVLRTEDIELLYMFRFYTADLCSNLRKLKVYRGSRQSSQCIDILRANKDRIISMNGFLLTSKDKQIALTFSGR